MTDIFLRVFVQEKVVEGSAENTFNPFHIPERKDEDHTGILVADECPVNTIEHQHGEQHAAYQVQQDDVSEEVGIPSGGVVCNRRPANQETRNDQHEECGALSPVPEAYRSFVHVHGFNRAFLNAVCPFRDFHKTS